MKKYLAMLLAVVMIASALFVIAPTAESDSGASSVTSNRYIPEIAYANVNYVDSIRMMFAVPVAELGEGESLKLILWNSREESVAFSYNDIIKIVLEPAAEKATIGGVEHLVFTYDGLDATKMTTSVCVRPVVIKDGVATSYGKLVEYSVLEYVESAKGHIDGIDGINNSEVIGLLDNMLAFGTIAEQTFNDKAPLYYPSDEVNKIYVTSVVNGIEKGRTLSGFFKKSGEPTASFIAPFIDGVTVTKVTDMNGNLIEDIDPYVDGYQIEASESDLEFKVHYDYVSVRNVNAASLGAGIEVNNYDDPLASNPPELVKKKSNVSYTVGKDCFVNISGTACTLDSNSRMNYWHSFKTVQDPSNPDNLVIQLTATGAPAFNLTNLKPSDFAGVGFGDTLYPAFTFEITLGAVNGVMPTTGAYYFRHRLKSEGGAYASSSDVADLYIFLVRNGKVMLYDTDSNYNNNVVVGEIPETGMRKFAITVDALTGMTYGYAENLETGVMEKTSESQINLHSKFIANQDKYLADPAANAELACYENIYTFFTKAKALEPIWTFGPSVKQSNAFEASSIEINGVNTPIKNSDGTFNMDAVKALAERDYSFLLDNFKLTMGAIYD